MLLFSTMNDLIARGIAGATILILLLATGCSSEKAPPPGDQVASTSDGDQAAPAIGDAGKTPSGPGDFDAILKKYVNGEFSSTPS